MIFFNVLIIIIIIGSANHPLLAVLRTELRRAQLTISGRKHTRAPLAAAIQSMLLSEHSTTARS